jgi:hypothetical protein
MRRHSVLFAWIFCILYSCTWTSTKTWASSTAAVGFSDCTIPFRFYYPGNFNLILVQGEVNGIKGYLIVDTGIEGIRLNADHFDGRETSLMSIGLNGYSPMRITKAQIEMGCLSTTVEEAAVMRFDGIIFDGPMILGLVGWGIFRRSELEIDYMHKELRVLALDRKGYRLADNRSNVLPESTLSLRKNGPLIYIRTMLAGRPLDLILDSGSGVNVLCNTLRKKLDGQFQMARFVNLAVPGGTGMIKVPKGQLTGLTAGGLTFPEMQTISCPMHLVNEQLDGERLDGIAGYPFFKHFMVSINFITHEVTLSRASESLALQE